MASESADEKRLKKARSAAEKKKKASKASNLKQNVADTPTLVVIISFFAVSVR